MAEFRAAQVGFSQIAARQIGAGQIAFFQILTGKIGASEVRAFSSRIAFMEFLVRFENVFQLLALVSNVSRLSRPRAAGKAPAVSLPFSEWMEWLSFYRKRQGKQPAGLTTTKHIPTLSGQRY